MAPLPELCAQALAREPDRHCVQYKGRWVTWGEIEKAAAMLQRQLDAGGVPDGAPVALIARNRPSAVAAYLALLAKGRTLHMFYPFQSPAAIAQTLRDLDVAAVVGDEEIFGPGLDALLTEREMAGIALAGFDSHAVPGHEEAGAAADAKGPDVPRIEILTSGTTGKPKPFPIPYPMAEEFFVAKSPFAKNFSGDDGPPTLLFMPMANISGIYTFLPTLLLGKPAVLMERFDLDEWLDYVREYRPVHAGLPPSFVRQLVDRDLPADALSSIRFMGIGAAPLDPEVQRAFEEKYDIPILISYGATEFGGPVASVTPQHLAEFGRSKTGTVGRAMPGAKLRIVDPGTGAEMPAGEQGVVEVVSPRMGEAWIRTSDLGRIDADGFLYICGRADSAIMRGGFKVLPETIENALRRHPAVSEATVVAVPDARLGQVPGAAIRPTPGAQKPEVEELKSFLRDHVLATHIPVHWTFVEDMPRNLSAKIDRPAVARLFTPDAG